MDIVAILKECLEVSKKNFLIFVPTVVAGVITFILVLVLVGGSVATMALKGGDVSSVNIGSMVGGLSLAVIASTILSFIAYAMTVAMAEQAINTGTTTLDTGWDAAKSCLVTVVIAAVLMGLIIGVGMLLLVIPGLLAICFLIFTLPAIVLDNLGAVDAMKKSYEVVKAHAGDVIIMIVAIFVLGILVVICQAIFSIIPLLGQLVGMLITGVFGGYITLVIVRVYRILSPAA